MKYFLRQVERACRILLFAFIIVLDFAGCGERKGPSPDQTGWVEPQLPDAKIALVFVHGINGDARDTWTRGSGPSFFDLLRQTDDIKNAVNVFAFGYPSKFLESGAFDIVDAANKLTEQLENRKIDQYPTVVYVAHSMGGLIVLQQLLNQREKMLPRVPLVMLYATPTEGAQIAALGKYVLSNPGLANMTPASHNTLLKRLNDDWVAMPIEKRPKVRCAFENKSISGVKIVEWTSATRYCSERPAAPINEDHMNIVKPTRAGDDSIVVLVNALRAEVIGKQADGKLETPDFETVDAVATFKLTDPFGRAEARLVNQGRLPLRYTIKNVSDPGALYYWPSDTPKQIAGGGVALMQFSAPNASTAEYKFTIQTNNATEQFDLPVVLKIPDFADYVKKRLAGAEALQEKIRKELQNTTQAQQAAPANGSDAVAVQAAFDYVKSRNEKLPDAGAWLMAANMLTTLQLPVLAKNSLQRAELISPSSVQQASAGQLGAIIADQLKQDDVFITRKTPKATSQQIAEFNSEASRILIGTPQRSTQALAREFERHESLRQFSPNLKEPTIKGPGLNNGLKLNAANDETKTPAQIFNSKVATVEKEDSKGAFAPEAKNNDRALDAIRSQRVTKQ